MLLHVRHNNTAVLCFSEPHLCQSAPYSEGEVNSRVAEAL